MADEFLDRFVGKVIPRLGGPPVANKLLADPVGLQLLFDEPLALDANEVQKALRDYHPEMANAVVELHFPTPEKPLSFHGFQPSFLGLLAWERHVIRLFGFTTPMPENVVKSCVQPAHFAPEFKNHAYQHKSHAVLSYVGYEQDPLEQYVALGAAAGSLAYFGASFVLNETGRSAVPAAVLHPHEEDKGDMLTALRGLPLPFLFCGFVKLEVEGTPGVWMRTYGAHRFGLPDFAYLAPGHEEGSATFETFSNLLAYSRHSGKQFTPGATVQVGDEVYLRLRARVLEEWYLESDGVMLVAERIRPDEVNR